MKDPSKTAKFVSDRHFGIGSDGLILIKPSTIADCEMDMYNMDGSQGAMCGNGIRCVAKYVYDHGIVPKTHLRIATKSGIKELDLTVENGKWLSLFLGQPVLPEAAVESSPAHPTLLCGFFKGDLFFLPLADNLGKLIRYGDLRSAKPDSFGLGSGDTLRLAFADVLPLALGYKAEDLQHQVRDEGSHQVFSLTGIQQWHIQYNDVHTFFFGKDTPLILNLLIIASQPVNAQNKEHIPRLQPAEQPFVIGTVEVFAGLLVHVDVFCGNVLLGHGDPLPFLILILAGNSDISVYCAFDMIDPLLKCEAILPHSMKKSLPGMSGRDSDCYSIFNRFRNPRCHRLHLWCR